MKHNIYMASPENGEAIMSIKTTGADGVKLAVLRKGRARLNFIRAAAHRQRSATNKGEI